MMRLIMPCWSVMFTRSFSGRVANWGYTPGTLPKMTAAMRTRNNWPVGFAERSERGVVQDPMAE